MSRITAKRSLVAVAAGVVALTSSLLVGTSADAATPKTGGKLYFLTHAEQLDYLDPSRIYTGRDLAFMNSFVTRTLVAYNPVPGKAGANLVPDLATNTGVPSNQAKTWSFTLRPGSTFEDGTAITCQHVKYGVSRVFATTVITNGPAYLQQWLAIPKDGEGDSVYKGPYVTDPTGQAAFDKAVLCSNNNRTITFKLNKSIADFNYLATYGVISPVQKTKDTGDKYDLKPQATGPYKIAENSKNQLRLVRNAKWKKSSDPVRTPYPAEVIIKFGLAEEVIDQYILNDTFPNAVNFDGPLPTNKDLFFNSVKFKNQRINTNDPYTRFWFFNTKKLTCKEVRGAIYHAYNSKALIDYAGGTEFAGSYATGIISPLLATDYAPTKVVGPGSPDFKPIGNPTKAKALLAAAKAKGGACLAEANRVTSEGFTVDVAKSATLADTIPINTEAFARAGIVINFNQIEPGSYYSTVFDPAKQSDMSSGGWAADWANASTVIPELFTSAGGFNLTQNDADPAYAAFEAKVKAAMLETNRAKQAVLWKALDKAAMANFWVMPTRFGKSQIVWGSKVGNAFFWVPQGCLAFGKLYVK